MGKEKASKLAMASITKNEKQLHRPIKVLRPKVYITNSSSFKQLVQEVTGYRAQTIDIPEEVENVPVTENIEIAAASIAATSMDSSFCMFESSEQAVQLEEINRVSGLTQAVDQDVSIFDHVSLATSKGQTDWLACQNLESWLFDDDDDDHDNDHEPYSWYAGCTLIEQETSIFDYELLY